jgi:hypothetical protein
MRRMAAAAALLLAANCGAPTAPTPAAEALELRLQTAHFRILGGRVSDATLRAAADRLETEYPRVLSDLGVAGVSVVTVKVWQDEAAFASESQRYFGQRLPATGYITGPDEVRVLATPALTVNAVHEFCHAVSLYVSPSFGNNPRWLWETVALYENGEFVDPRTLDYMVRGAYPTLQQLNAGVDSSQQVYQLGFVLGEFITTRWGRDGFVRLIQANGDLRGALGISPAEFETAWAAWVRARYLS